MDLSGGIIPSKNLKTEGTSRLPKKERYSDSVSGYRDARDGRYGDGKGAPAAGCRMLIIFVTAYPDFVFQGYEVQAFHYILKPYQPAKIKEVLTKALRETEQTERGILSSRTSRALCVSPCRISFILKVNGEAYAL